MNARFWHISLIAMVFMCLWLRIDAFIVGKTPVVQPQSSVHRTHRDLASQPRDDREPDVSYARPPLSKNIQFTVYMSLAGAALGPFLDSFHSAFGALRYDAPITATLWGSNQHPALITTWWVPALFGVAGCLIGWLYILLDRILLDKAKDSTKPSLPKVLIGISFFTFQYYLSGLLYTLDVDRTGILNIMSILAAAGFVVLDGTLSGLLVSAATAIGGPLIEVGLLTLAKNNLMMGSGYHYTDPGETGFFPLWIAPVYFLGGPAVGNLARCIYQAISFQVKVTKQPQAPCTECNDTRCVPCPNCDGLGTYVAMGARGVTCTSCRGRGFVVCRACFDRYNEDPADIEAIRELMRRMPD